MKLLERILLATDLSEKSDNILANAIELATTFNSKINLIHVLPNDIKNEKVKPLLIEASISRLDELNEHIKSKGLQTEKPILKYGSFIEKIVSTAKEINANVIFIGAGEKSNKGAFHLGTTTENIIRKTKRPVWVVKNDKPLKIANILCPVDFSKESGRALKNAIIIARKVNAKLTIISANQLVYTGSLSLKIDMEDQDNFVYLDHEKEFQSFLEKFKLSDLEWEKQVYLGDPADTIIKAIEINKIDLLFMGTRGKTGLSKLLMGSVTEKVIRRVPCSFITIKSRDIINQN